MNFGSAISTSLFNVIGSARLGERKRVPANVESAKHNTVLLRRDYHGKDIDEYRARLGKEEGEAAFFHDNFEDERKIAFENLFMFNGAALLWQAAQNLGSTTANQTFSSGVTLLTNANTYLYVSDGGYGSNLIGGGSTTVGISNGSTTLTTSTSNPSNLSAGLSLVINTDSSFNVYTVVSGTGTSWTITPAFTGTSISTSPGVTAGTFAAPSHSNTTIPGSTNVASQVADAGFPTNPISGANSTVGTITGAASNPIQLNFSGITITANDIVQVVEVGGNTNANGVFVANPGGTTTCTLQGTTTNATYTSGGLIAEKGVLTVQSTFGSSAAVFLWNCWALQNGNSTNKYLINLRNTGLGGKASGTSSALKIGIGIS